MLTGTGKRNARKSNATQAIWKALRDPFFPWTFFVANLLTLSREKRWQGLSARVRNLYYWHLLLERSRFFLEVKSWIGKQGSWVPMQAPSLVEHESIGIYCDHCGHCCEIASGLDAFPDDVEIPRHWQWIFGTGLGRGHRFCPFLWEFRKTGRSLCAIHAWRPTACRMFERDECLYLKDELSLLSSLDAVRNSAGT
jgi:hypothetical protein